MDYSVHVAHGEVRSEFLPQAVPYAVTTPTGGEPGPFPLCIVLHGGVGSRQTLSEGSRIISATRARRA